MVSLAENPSSIRYGDLNISAVYWKDEKIWPAAPPPAPTVSLISLSPTTIDTAGDQTITLTVRYETQGEISTNTYALGNIELVDPTGAVNVANRFIDLGNGEIRYEYDLAGLAQGNNGEWPFRTSTSSPVTDNFAGTVRSLERVSVLTVAISPPAAIPILNDEWESSDGEAQAFNVGPNLRIIATAYDLIYDIFNEFGGDQADPKRFRISWQVASVNGADCWLYVFDNTGGNFDFVKEDGVTPIYEALTPGAGSVIYDEAVNTNYLGGPSEAVAVLVECDDVTQIDFVGGFLIEEI